MPRPASLHPHRVERIGPPLAPNSALRVGLSSMAALAISMGAGLAQAETETTLETLKELHPYASVSYTNDSNLIRKSSDAAALIPGLPSSRSDDYLTVEAGLNTEFDVSRQRILVDGRIYRNTYDRFDQLDHTGGDARIMWKWERGKLWNGSLGYLFSRKLRSLENQATPIRDMLDRHTIVARANRALTDRWSIRTGAAISDLTSSERDRLKKQIINAVLTLLHESEVGNTYGLEAKLSDAAFDIDSDRDYKEWYLGPRTRWQLTAKTSLTASAGYLKREHDQLQDSDFDGLVGEIAATWQATSKTAVTVTAARNISNLEDEIAEYAEVKLLAIEPSWAITDKTTLRGLLQRERRDFDYDLIPSRRDDIDTAGLWLDWQLSPNSLVSVGYEHEEQDSTDALLDYDSRAIVISIRIGL